MRTVRILVVVVVAAVLAAAAHATPAGSSSSVRLVADAPVTVAGQRFKPRERVTVRVAPTGRAAYSKVVTATRTGTFTAVFAGRSIPECSGVRISAVGALGSRASRVDPPPPCGIDPAP